MNTVYVSDRYVLPLPLTYLNSSEFSDKADVSNIKYITLDFEANGLNSHSLTPLIAALRINNHSLCYTFDLLCPSSKALFISLITDLLNQNILVMGHNLKYDLKVILNLFGDKHREITFSNWRFFDTMIFNQVYYRGLKKRNGLKDVLLDFLAVDISKSVRDEFTKITDKNHLFTTAQFEYAASDVKYILPLVQSMARQIPNERFKQYLEEVEFPLIPIIASLEHDGLRFDKTSWVENTLSTHKQMLELEQQLDKELVKLGEPIVDRYQKVGEQLGMFGEPSTVSTKVLNPKAFNYNSPLQLKGLYYKHAGQYNLPQDKDGEFSTGKESLEKFLRDSGQNKMTDFTKMLLTYRKLSKIYSSFGYNFVDFSKKTHRIHTSYKQSGTATGRFTSGDSDSGFPNMSQIPRSNSFRKCFLADEGYKGVTIDLAQAELRILASESGDSVMIDLINNGDMHSYLASKAMTKLKGQPFVVNKEQNSDIRTKFKNVNFGLIYGATSYRISELLNISVDDAEIVYQVICDEIPLAMGYLKNRGEQAVRENKVLLSDYYGVYRLFEPDHNDWAKRREAMNAPIQGLNAIMIKLAMVAIHKFFVESGCGRIKLQVYDELYMEVKDDENFEKNLATIQQLMKNSCNFMLKNGVEMEIETAVSDGWVK
jgi:DNA polymerase-1